LPSGVKPIMAQKIRSERLILIQAGDPLPGK
jgi:hypothetical protein